ncbi:hypothetical protein [Rubrivirga sp.]|uniref:hypothetical protein n=1 Tax=Rubrivirga sp. TaxID=1885344 RepID=UPI003B52C7CB
MTGRGALTVGLGLGGLALGIALLARDTGPDARVSVPGATAAVLDTLSVRGRRVEASLDGTVVQVGPGDDVWVEAGGDAVPLRFRDDPGLEVEDRVLAVGRLRDRGGRRWVAVESWARVEPDVRPPSAGGL